jgi:hypothetical protein
MSPDIDYFGCQDDADLAREDDDEPRPLRAKRCPECGEKHGHVPMCPEDV